MSAKKTKFNSGNPFKCTEIKQPQSSGITSDKLVPHSGASMPVLRTLLKKHTIENLSLHMCPQAASLFQWKAQDREARTLVYSFASATDLLCDLEQVSRPLTPDLTTSQRCQKNIMKSWIWKHFAKHKALYKCEGLLSKQILCQPFWYHPQDLFSFGIRFPISWLFPPSPT